MQKSIKVSAIAMALLIVLLVFMSMPFKTESKSAMASDEPVILGRGDNRTYGVPFTSGRYKYTLSCPTGYIGLLSATPSSAWNSLVLYSDSVQVFEIFYVFNSTRFDSLVSSDSSVYYGNIFPTVYYQIGAKVPKMVFYSDLFYDDLTFKLHTYGENFYDFSVTTIQPDGYQTSLLTAIVDDTQSPLTITTQPTDMQVKYGWSNSLSFKVTVPSGKTVSYQWYKDNVVIENALSNSLSLSNSLTADDTTSITAKYKCKAVCEGYVDTWSDEVTVTYLPIQPLTISTDLITGQSDVAIGGSRTLKFKAVNPTNSYSNVNFQWYVDGEPFGDVVSSYNLQSFVVSESTVGGGTHEIKCKAYASGFKDVWSNIVIIKVLVDEPTPSPSPSEAPTPTPSLSESPTPSPSEDPVEKDGLSDEEKAIAIIISVIVFGAVLFVAFKIFRK